MGEDDDGNEPGLIQDPRWEWLENFTLRTLNQKGDKWSKMANNEEFKPIVQDWLDKAEVKTLVITNPGQLVPSHEFPSSTKNKSAYFVKREPCVIPKSKIVDKVMFGDLSSSPLEQLSSVVEEIISTVLMNPKNYEEWPEVVSNDVLKHVHQLKSDVYVTAGSVKGETLLPLPVGAERIDQNPQHALGIRDDGDNKKSPIDRHLIQSMQNSVIEWTRQVKDVICQDSASACIDGHPTPQVEINFWDAREANLFNIYHQLKTPHVRKLGTVLKIIDSTYYGTLYNMFLDVVDHLRIAQDITCHLKPFRNVLDELEQADFGEIIEKKFTLLASVAECVGLIWGLCLSYQDPVRVVVLSQTICNLFIELAKNYLDPENILKGEIDESLDKVVNTIKVLDTYKEYWFNLKDRVKNGDFKSAKGEIPPEWNFATSLVFARFDNFLRRLNEMLNLFNTANEYLKLEKIEFGGISGGALSLQVVHLFDEFNKEYKKFQEANYDPLNWAKETDQFRHDYKDFMAKIDDFDRRLAKCAVAGFNDCANVEAMFKLLAIFGTLTQRPLIATDFDENYTKLIKTYDEELDTAKRIYDKQLEDTKRLGYAPVHDFQPPVAGQLKWAKELRLRISKPRDQLKLIDHPVMRSEQADIVFAKYDQMEQLITEFEERVYKEWVGSVDEACSFNLNQPILNRNDNNVISVNFDRALTTVLREVKYLKFLERTDIPESATKLYEQNDKLRQLNANLDRTTSWYNKIRETLNPVEAPIVAKQIEDIDNYLKESETNLHWSSDSVENYTNLARDKVHDLEQRIQSSKDNVIKIEEIMDKWCKQPLYERKQDQKDPKQRILDIEHREEKRNKRYASIQADGEEIHKLILENKNLLKADDGDENDWFKYLDFIDEKIIRGFETCIKHSLDYLYENMEMSNNQVPLFQAKLLLELPRMIFSPSLDPSTGDVCFQRLIQSIINDIFQIASLMKRVAHNHTSEDYVSDIDKGPEKNVKFLIAWSLTRAFRCGSRP